MLESAFPNEPRGDLRRPNVTSLVYTEDRLGGLMDLKEWNAALLRALRDEGRPGRPLYLHVDRAELASISKRDSKRSAIEDFCSAYQCGARPADPFGLALDQARCC